MRSSIARTPCPFRCRCISSSPTSHHICSVGACLCYNDADHVCGCRANVCRPERTQLSHGNMHCINRPTSSSISARYAAKYSSAEAPSCAGSRDTSMLEFANLNFVLRRLSTLKKKLERNRRLQASTREEFNSAIEDCANDDDDDDYYGDYKYHNNHRDYDHAAMQAAAMELEKMKLPMLDEHVRGFCTCERKHAARAGSRKEKAGQEEGDRPRKQYAAQAGSRIKDGQEEEGDCRPTNSIMDIQSRREMDELWGSYNCGVHLKRLVESSRKAVACRVVESTAQVRLTTHLWAHVRSTAQAIPAGDRRAHFLGTFHLSRKTRAGGLAGAGDTSSATMLQLQEPATYADMLRLLVAAQKRDEERAGDQEEEDEYEEADVEVEVVEKALASAEEGLLEEVRSPGFPNSHSSPGGIRLQMSALLSSQPQSSLEIKDGELTPEFLFDIIKAIEQGKLESLKPAHELVKLGCFMMLKQLNLANTNQVIGL